MLKGISKSSLFYAVFWGLVWGIFESTFGYILHLLPISLGFLVWYPAAFFFMSAVYRNSGKPQTILISAIIASGIKLANLLLPGSVDKVLNPAFSILFEGLAVYLGLVLLSKAHPARRKSFWAYFGMAFGVNCTWRALYAGYVAFIVPQWLERSVLRSGAAAVRFLVVDNLASSALILLVILLFARFRGDVFSKKQLTKETIT